ncbi:hypothetical protein [Paragemmobacter ruber]|uniref:Uncharacterized protein n=1 Tax=Paragemmobacter ruber TaxID=1985673 RepID=A0ABW9Y1S8_9RHOB|nr:hypothetical protein [Rhodobacter ruber]NBE06458.1 hypothetical protein [Rhodobacter ruber]
MAGVTCAAAAGVDMPGADALCQAVGAILAGDGRAADETAAVVEVLLMRPERVVARLRWGAAAAPGPEVEIMAMDGPLLPDWPERLASDLVRATPPP